MDQSEFSCSNRLHQDWFRLPITLQIIETNSRMNIFFIFRTVPAERFQLAILQLGAIDVEHIGPQSGQFAVLPYVVERNYC